MERCTWMFHYVLAILNALLGCIAMITFLYLENYQGAFWAFFAALFASIVLFLHIRYKRMELESCTSLSFLEFIGFFVGIISSGFCIFYLFLNFYNHIPMNPVSDNMIIPAVWSFMTAKWAFFLRHWSIKYRVEVLYGYGPLNIESDIPNA